MSDPAEARLAQILTDATSARRIVTVSNLDVPHNLGRGSVVQAAVLASLGERLVGWKLGMTTAEAQRRRGLSGPLVSRLVASRRFSAPRRFASGHFVNPYAEAEFGFLFHRDVSPRDGPAETRRATIAAVGALVPAIEIVDARLEDWRNLPPALSLADNLGHGAVVTGDPVKDWSPDDLRNTLVTLSIDGETRATGTGAEVLGDPVKALVWLVEELARRGEGIVAGELVITGTCTGVIPLKRGATVQADFGRYGNLTCVLAQ